MLVASSAKTSLLLNMIFFSFDNTTKKIISANQVGYIVKLGKQAIADTYMIMWVAAGWLDK